MDITFLKNVKTCDLCKANIYNIIVFQLICKEYSTILLGCVVLNFTGVYDTQPQEI